MFMLPTLEQEVLSLIKDLRNNKAPGHNNVNVYLLKTISRIIVSVLTYLY